MAIPKQSFSFDEKIEGLFNENKRIFEDIKKIKDYDCIRTFFEVSPSPHCSPRPLVTVGDKHVSTYHMYPQQKKAIFIFTEHICSSPFVYTPTFFGEPDCRGIHKLPILEKLNQEIYDQSKKTKSHVKNELQEEILGQLVQNLFELNVYIGKIYTNLIDTNESKMKQAEVILARIQKEFDELAFLTEFIPFELSPSKRPVLVIGRRGVDSDDEEKEEEGEGEKIMGPYGNEIVIQDEYAEVVEAPLYPITKFKRSHK